MHNYPTRVLLAVPLISAALVLTGCGQSAQQPYQPVPGSVIALPPAVLTFGQSHTWPNGDTITIGAPQRRSVTSAYSGRVDTYIAADVTVHNAGPAAKDANSYVVYATVNDRDVTPTAVPEFGGSQTGIIAPGGTLHFVMAYPVTDATPVHFQMQAFGEQLDPARPVVSIQPLI